jgi:predicted TIM-barrel fold metal-dependent hydrolase
VPWVKRPPGRIIREQLRFASQPTVEMTARELTGLIDQMGSDELICFSTDYPHWDFDSPLEALPPGLPDDLARKIFLDNARATYRRLPAAVPA